MRPRFTFEESRARLLPRPGRRYLVLHTAVCQSCFERSPQDSDTAARRWAVAHTCEAN